jgi:hypothetical protein
MIEVQPKNTWVHKQLNYNNLEYGKKRQILQCIEQQSVKSHSLVQTNIFLKRISESTVNIWENHGYFNPIQGKGINHFMTCQNNILTGATGEQNI